MRALLPILIAALPAVWGLAQPVEVPEDIAGMYDRFYEALATNNRSEAEQAMAPEALLLVVLENGGPARSVLSLPDKYVLDTLEPTFTECLVSGKCARVSYDLRLVGVETDTGEEVDLTLPRIDWLLLGDRGWGLLRSIALDTEGQAVVAEGGIEDGEFGVSLPVPEGWEAYAVQGNSPRQVSILGADPRTVITLSISQQPEAPAPEALLPDLPNVMPMLGGSAELLESGEVALGGLPGYHSDHRIRLQSLTLRHAEIGCFAAEDLGATLYVLSLTTTADEAFEEAKPVFDGVTANLTFTEKQPIELPAEYGTLTDGTYLNLEHQVRLDLPEGWQARILRNGREPFMLVAAKPGLRNHLALIMVEIGQWVDPQEIARGNLQAQQERAKRLKTIDEGVVEKGAVSGYRMVMQGPRSTGESSTIWQTYLMRSTTLFVLGGYVTPQEGYESLKDEWRQVEGSLKLGPEALEAN